MHDSGGIIQESTSHQPASLDVSDPSPQGAGRFLESGDEAGTAPGDRKFRPDVEGLRAVAILLVVLFHAGVPRLTGGFVGVDVFFVISGFVITGLLLREHAASGKTRLSAFYGRRSRRILPAATLVIILTVLASYHWLGFITGDETAGVARAASLFYANFHFIAAGTNYLASQQPPSALQNFWSLSVEEQFYLVYPALFFIAAFILRHVSLRLKLTALLVFGIEDSFAWSLHQTSTNGIAAFFSPFSRAWELALGALVAVGSLQLAKIPKPIASAMSWVGLGGILIAAFSFTSSTPYPGSAAALPVISTALVIAGGMTCPRNGGELLLRLPPFQWMGRLSYSLYLWHWPVLIIAAQHVGHPLSVYENLLWLLLALALSIVSYCLIENPLRHWKLLTRSGALSIFMGLLLICSSLAVATFEISSHSAPPSTAPPSTAPPSTATSAAGLAMPSADSGCPSTACSAVLTAVAAGARLTTLPSGLTPPLQSASTVLNVPASTVCEKLNLPGSVVLKSVGPCTLGANPSSPKVVVFGDSHALMWSDSFITIAERAGYTLTFLAYPACRLPLGIDLLNLPPDCDAWRQAAIDWIQRDDPAIVVVTSIYTPGPGASAASYTQFAVGWERLLGAVSAPGRRLVLLGSTPVLGQDPLSCLAAHETSIQDCGSPTSQAVLARTVSSERVAASKSGASYVNVTPWLCTRKICPAVIGDFRVYSNQFHITREYGAHLAPLLQVALRLGG